MTREVSIGAVTLGGCRPLAFIGGPCVIEGEDFTLRLADRLIQITGRAGVPFIFKASYDKANRTSASSFRGPGLEEGIEILARVKAEFGCPILSDVHEASQVRTAAEVLDVIQIPAFLCRQTDLLLAAARTGRAVNVKKGQFLAPWDVKPLIEKVTGAGNQRVLLTERGVSFGYNMLVTDFLGLPIMRGYGYPVIFDVGHSLQMPSAAGTATGGRGADFAFHLGRAAAAVGVDGLFMEVHFTPEKSMSDAATAFPVDLLPRFLEMVKILDERVKAWEGGKP